MFVNTRGISSEYVLLALYRHAIANSSRNQPAQVDPTHLMGYRVTAGPLEAFMAFEDSRTKYFADIDLNEGIVSINTSLANPEGFESAGFDALYGDGAALTVIKRLRDLPAFRLEEDVAEQELALLADSKLSTPNQSASPSRSASATPGRSTSFRVLTFFTGGTSPIKMRHSPATANSPGAANSPSTAGTASPPAVPMSPIVGLQKRASGLFKFGG